MTTTTMVPLTPTAIVLAGLPGSGKTTAAKILQQQFEQDFVAVEHHEVSDFVRARYRAKQGGGVTDNELGRWAAEKKSEHGDDYFVRELAREQIEREHTPHTIISGVRSPDEAEAVRDLFGAENTAVVAIWTLPTIRFRRKYDETPTPQSEHWDTFQERNERELHDWGCKRFFERDGPSDYIVPNNNNVDSLRSFLKPIYRAVVNGADEPDYLQTPPLPDKLGDKLEEYL